MQDLAAIFSACELFRKVKGRGQQVDLASSSDGDELKTILMYAKL